MKKIGVVLLALMVMLSVAACGGKKEAADNAAPAKAEKITVRLLTRMAGTSTQVQIYQSVLDEFKAKHPEVEIIDDSQGDESAFNNILTTDIASGNMANIFRIQGVSNLGEYIKNGLLLDVAPFIKDDAAWGNGFSKGSLAYYQVPGYKGTYAVPMESGLIGLYYNEKIMKSIGYDGAPKTWSELLDAVAKLKAKGITPIALGAQSTYMAGHFHDQVFYKWLGTEAAKKLGNRSKKWTDKDVVESLAYVKELYDIGAFDAATVGMTDDIAMTQFSTGEAAMVVTGPWMIGRFSDPERTPEAANIRVAKFPYFDSKPEFKDEDMQVLSPYMISGKLKGKELDLTIELVKMLTNKEVAKRYAEEASFALPRNDIDLDPAKCKPLFLKNVQLGGTSSGISVDVFDFDPVTSMQDRTRNSIVSMFTGVSPEDAAAEIQAEIDNAR